MANLWTPGSGDTSGEITVSKLKAFSSKRSTEMGDVRQAMIDDGSAESDAEARALMRESRRGIRTQGVAGMGGGGSRAQIQFASGRPRDPMFYWRENNLPYDLTKDKELAKVRAFCRLLYLTHPIRSEEHTSE